MIYLDLYLQLLLGTIGYIWTQDIQSLLSTVIYWDLYIQGYILYTVYLDISQDMESL